MVFGFVERVCVVLELASQSPSSTSDVVSLQPILLGPRGLPAPLVSRPTLAVGKTNETIERLLSLFLNNTILLTYTKFLTNMLLSFNFVSWLYLVVSNYGVGTRSFPAPSQSHLFCPRLMVRRRVHACWKLEPTYCTHSDYMLSLSSSSYIILLIHPKPLTRSAYAL